MIHGVRGRLLLILVPASLLILAVVAAGVGRVARAVMRPVIEGSSLIILGDLADQIAAAGANGEEIAAAFERHLVQPDRSCLLWVVDGQVTAHAGELGQSRQLIAEAETLLGGSTRAATVTGFGPIHARLLAAMRPAPGRLVIFEHRLHGLWTRFTIGGIVVAAAVLLTAVAFAAVVATGLQRPLVTRLAILEDALADFAAGRTHHRVPLAHDPPDEFDHLYQSYNRMADRITELETERRERRQAERRLLADLAHDVNTPITILRGYAETLLDRGARLDAAARHGIATEMLGQSLYVQAIVEDLLTMASARSAELRMQANTVPLDGLFDTVVDSFQPLADRHGIVLVGDARGVVAWADPVRLRQILTNLVRNALLHAAGATLIELGASRSAEEVTMWVQDNGSGVPEAEQAQLFERHHTGHDHNGHGWGLGLAIVQTLAELHGGSASYRDAAPGARFEVRLPHRTGA